MLDIRLEDNAIRLGKHASVRFQRTLRIPDDGKDYPLPPGLGSFPLRRVEEYRSRVPTSWTEKGGFFIPMYQREAMWLSFDGVHWRPNAIKIGIGNVNAVSGDAWDMQLRADPQDYLVVPDQPWLDGINAGDGFIRQFVAMPLGSGYTVEGQVTGREDVGGFQIAVFDPKPGRFPNRPPRRCSEDVCCYMCESPLAMGLGAGGRMRQEIYEDEYSLDTWDQTNQAAVNIHIVNSAMYREITGEAPPPTPIDAHTYTEHGYPWFELYDEQKRVVPASDLLAAASSVREIDQQRAGDDLPPEESLALADGQVVELRLKMGPPELTGKFVPASSYYAGGTRKDF